MDHLTEQDAGLLEQGATMLEERAEEQRTMGNDSAAEGAACSAHAIRRLAPAMLRAGHGCLAQIEEPAGAAPAAVAGPNRDEIAALRAEHGITSTGRGIKEFEQVDAFVRAVLQRWGAAPALEAPAAPAVEALRALMSLVRREAPHLSGKVMGEADAILSRAALAPAPQAQTGAPDWWRKRADEIEVQVAATGSSEAMRCYTDMRTLLQAAAAPQAPAAPSYPPAFGPNDWVMSVAGTVVKLSEWEPGAVKARTIYGDAAPAAPAVDASTVADMARALEMLVGSDALHSLCEHEGIDAIGRVKGTWSKAAECNARSTLLIHRKAIDALIAAQAKEGGAK